MKKSSYIAQIVSRVVPAVFFIFYGLWAVGCGPVYSADTYFEDFDEKEDDITIDGIDYWGVYEGAALNVITQDAITYSGGGKALKIIGVETNISVKRSKSLGGLSPCWIEYMLNPGKGAQARNVPEGKIASVCFDYTGKILAADGSSWCETGETFTPGEWYRVILKLNFGTHQYDIYVETAANPKSEFTPVKENLDFIDKSISSISEIGFSGAYSESQADDSYVDELIVHFVDRLEVTTLSQNLIKDKASNEITVQIQNAYSEPQTAWRDIILELMSSSTEGEFSLSKDDWKPVTQVTIAEGAQAVSFYYKDNKTGKPTISVSEYPDRGWTDAAYVVEIVPEADFFTITTTKPQVAGQYFDVAITAKDEDGNISKLYDGTVDIFVNYVNPSGGTKIIFPQEVSGFEEGQLETSLMYPDCGIIEIRAQDQEEASKNGTSGQILFVPASFSVEADTPQVVSRDFPVTITSLNTNSEVTPNYIGSVDLGAVLVSPANLPAGSFEPVKIEQSDFANGKAAVNASYSGWGGIRIKASDTQYPIRAGVSGDIQFYPNSLLIEVSKPPSGRSFFYVGEEIQITMKVLDFLNEPIFNYLETVNISATQGLNLPSDYTFIQQDGGSHKFSTSSNATGTYRVYFNDPESELKSNEISIEAKRATLEVVSTASPVGTAEIIIRLVDDEGNVIDTENSLNVTIELEEELDNESASSSATIKPVTFSSGIAKILVSNPQAEIVTIIPSSGYDFKIKRGAIIFGRISKTGIGALMWREIEE